MVSIIEMYQRRRQAEHAVRIVFSCSVTTRHSDGVRIRCAENRSGTSRHYCNDICKCQSCCYCVVLTTQSPSVPSGIKFCIRISSILFVILYLIFVFTSLFCLFFYPFLLLDILLEFLYEVITSAYIG